MKMRVINKIAFPNPNFICSIIFSIKMRVFLAAALDMSFKIYDRKLDLLESIRHDERAILQLKYDAIDDVFLASGASGKSSMMLNALIQTCRRVSTVLTSCALSSDQVCRCGNCIAAAHPLMATVTY